MADTKPRSKTRMTVVEVDRQKKLGVGGKNRLYNSSAALHDLPFVCIKVLVASTALTCSPIATADVLKAPAWCCSAECGLIIIFCLQQEGQEE